MSDAYTREQKMRKVRQWVALLFGLSAFGLLLAWESPAVQTIKRDLSCTVRGGFGVATPFVPVGAPWSDEEVFRISPPAQYTAGAAWITAATATECIATDAEALIEIESMRVVAVDSNGAEETVYENHFGDAVDVLDGGWFARYPTWFASDARKELVRNVERGRMQIDLTQGSLQVAHLWTPRFAIEEGKQYVVEARLRVGGVARIQFGVDYWRDFEVEFNHFDEFCRGANNCEAHVGAWISDTDGAFVTVRSPL